MPFRTLLATVLVVAAAAAAPVAAQASPGLLLGIDDDALKWFSQTNALLSIYGQLGVGAVRVTLNYTPGETFPAGTDRTELQRVGNASRRIRVVLAVTGQPSSPPLDDASRAAFCGFTANVVRRYPAIHDVAIWTEPNSGRFWQPQKGASGAYEALLATCWDTLHAVQPGMNIIATSAPHQSPATGTPASALRIARAIGSCRSSTLSATTRIPTHPASRPTSSTRTDRSTKATSPVCSRR